MAELDDRLKRLVSDDQSMKKVLDLASAIMAQRSAARAEPEKKEEAAPDTDMASMLASILQQQKGESKAAPEADHSGSSKNPADTAESSTASASQPEQKNTVGALAEALPQLMQALSGNGELIQGDRLNLLKAMKPYLTDKRIGSIDRALKMANVTKAAKSALHILGR